MKFAMPKISVKSNWFEHRSVDNKFKQMGLQCFYLYINLFRFRIYNQDQETFITSIRMLREETGYKTKDIYDMLKKLEKLKVIARGNLSKWEQLYSNDKKIDDNRIIVLTAPDYPDIHLAHHGTEEEKEEHRYSMVESELIQYYIDLDLKDKYIPILFLITKLSNNKDINHKCVMSVETMAFTLGIDKSSINKRIWDLNRNYLLYSSKSKIKNSKDKYKWEHSILFELKGLEKFKKSVGHEIDKAVAKHDKKKVAKSNKTKVIAVKDNNEVKNDTPVIDPCLTFVDDIIPFNPFADLDEQYITKQDDVNEWGVPSNWDEDEVI